MAKFTSKTTEEIVDDILVSVVSELPEVTDINPGSVLSTLSEAIATELEAIYTQQNNIYDGTRIETSTEDDLDQLGTLVGVLRKQGTIGTGNATFIRTNPANSDFNIPAAAVISTQPNTGDEQLRFEVVSNTTFQATVTGETHTFKSGIYDYPLNERFISSVTTLAGTVSAAPFVFVQNTDFLIVKNVEQTVVDPTTITSYDTMEVAQTDNGWFGQDTIRDDCDSAVGWAATAEGTIALNTTIGDQKQGIGCLNLEKAAGAQAAVTYDHSLSTQNDFTSKHVFVWYYIDNKNDLTLTDCIELRYGDDGANHWYKRFSRADLSNGWNFLGFSSATATGVTGVPVLTNADYVAIRVTYDTVSIVKTGNQQRIDWWRVAYLPVEDAVTYRQGTKALRFQKLPTTTDNVVYAKTAPSVVDSEEKTLAFWLYVKDATALGKIASLNILFGSGGSSTNSYEATFDPEELITGWQIITVDPNGSGTTKNGAPEPTAINYAQVTIETNTIADTLSADDLILDWLFFADTTEYIGDLIRFLQAGTEPDDASTFSTTYKPLSKEVPVQAVAVGAKYNVGRQKVIYKVSIVANIDTVNNYVVFSNGSDLETDDEYRERIKNSSLAGKATVTALEQAILAVSGVRTVSVNDLPPGIQNNEPHLFLTGTDNYQVDFEIAQDDVILDVTGTVLAAPYTFLNGTDYILNDLSEIVWQTGGTKPDNNTIFFVDYNYRWLGHVQILVTGVQAPIPIGIQNQIDTAIEDTKAAGVEVSWAEPTIITVNVTALISAQPGYTVSQLQNKVKTAIEDYMNEIGAGVDVYLANLYKVIQAVEGVLNSSITTPVADIPILVDEVARPGTISVGSL